MNGISTKHLAMEKYIHYGHALARLSSIYGDMSDAQCLCKPVSNTLLRCPRTDQGKARSAGVPNHRQGARDWQHSRDEEVPPIDLGHNVFVGILSSHYEM